MRLMFDRKIRDFKIGRFRAQDSHSETDIITPLFYL